MDKTIPSEVFAEAVKASDGKAVIWDGLDSAVIGSARIWRDGEWRNVVVYSFDRLCDAVHSQSDSGLTYDEAVEHVEYNIAGGYVGAYTPLIVRDWA